MGFRWIALWAALPMGAQDAPGWFHRTANQLEEVWRTGRTDIYLSGLYWHLPFAYSPERRRELNDAAWGLGYGHSLMDAKGNEHSLFLQWSRSSHFKPQYAAGYAWLAQWPLPGGFRAGVGYAAFVFARSDVYGYLPIPGIVPMASLGSGRWQLQVTYLPGLGNGITGTGQVVYLLARVSF